MPTATYPSERSADRAGLQFAARCTVVCAATVVAVALAGGGSAFWLCVPAALVLAAPARNGYEAAVGGALAAAAAAAAETLGPSAGPMPPLTLGVVVVATSVAILHLVRTRARSEREQLRASALSDPLTGAANRRALAELVEYEVARHERLRHSFAVVMLDLDGFKLVNDRFGHPAGDELLRDVAQALRRAVRDQDTVARLGGDEFCVLAPETDRAGSARLAARAGDAVSRVTAGLDALSASVGVALFPDDGAGAREVLAAADAAQTEAKRAVHAGGARRRAA